MISIRTLDGKYTHTARSVKVTEEESRNSLYLWSSPEGIRLYMGNKYEGHELPMSSLVDEITKHKGREIYEESIREGKEYGERSWKELKETLEKEYHFCPFCKFPEDVQSANWKVLGSMEELRKHIAGSHLSISTDVKVIWKAEEDKMKLEVKA